MWPKWWNKRKEIFRSGEPRTRIYRLRHAVTGEYRWIEDSAVPLKDEQGNLIGIGGIARDITDFRLTEQIMRAREAHLETLIDAMPDGVLVADDAGRIVQSNAGMERILGSNSEELVGQTVDPASCPSTVPSFAPMRGPAEVGSVPARRHRRGTIWRMFDADRAERFR